MICWGVKIFQKNVWDVKILELHQMGHVPFQKSLMPRSVPLLMTAPVSDNTAIFFLGGGGILHL